MKKIYEKPMMSVENFAANEFIAACGDSGKVYKFHCDAGNGKHGDVFLDSNGNGILDKGDENLTKGRGMYFYACNQYHEADTDVFPKGFYVQNRGNDRFNERLTGRPYPVEEVRIWRGNHGNEVHATTNLDINSWETLKS